MKLVKKKTKTKNQYFEVWESNGNMFNGLPDIFPSLIISRLFVQKWAKGAR